MPTLQPTKPRAPAGRSGVWETRIPGRFRKITVHQLVMAWWLFKDKQITKRQLRIFFAAHEMAERRSYMPKEAGREARKPLYTIVELRKLIGGSRTKKAETDLRADVKALGRIGLVEINSHAISFAVSIDQIRIDDVNGFWSMFTHFDHPRRTISMPRRTCRALAGGFQTSVMAMMVALMIRSLFWHRPGGKAGEGGYRIDGRTKCSFVSQVMGVSRRSVTEARSRLIELGWITPLDAPQWALNKWGQQYVLNLDAFAPEQRNQADIATGQSASPNRENTGEMASPCLNNSASSFRRIIKTRTPDPTRSDPAGFCNSGEKGSRKKNTAEAGATARRSPTLKNITDDDLRQTDRLLELHDQAVERGLVNGSEAGRLDFLALAERARSQGNDPARLFAWLITHRRFEFITIADEERASGRLKEHRNGPREELRPNRQITRPGHVEWSEDERLVMACIRVGKQYHRDPFSIAREAKGWSRDHWDEMHTAVEQKDRDRWTNDAE